MEKQQSKNYYNTEYRKRATQKSLKKKRIETLVNKLSSHTKDDIEYIYQKALTNINTPSNTTTKKTIAVKKPPTDEEKLKLKEKRLKALVKHMVDLETDDYNFVFKELAEKRTPEALPIGQSSVATDESRSATAEQKKKPVMEKK